MLERFVGNRIDRLRQGREGFTEVVSDALQSATTDLRESGHITENGLRVVSRGIQDWMADAQHGIDHSFNVFMGSLHLREKLSDQYPKYRDVSDHELSARAVLHDMVPHLPILDKNGEASFPNEAKRRRVSILHPQVIGMVVSRFAPSLGIPPDQYAPLRVDIKYQDQSFSHPDKKRIAAIGKLLSPAGELFNDADRLAGAGELDDPNSIRISIHRNRVGSLGKWYIFRPDLSLGDRWEWRMRTGGFFDGASALFKEFLGYSPDYAYTPYGKAMAAERRLKFEENFIRYYQKERERGINDLLPLWENPDRHVEMGIKNDREQNGIVPINNDLVESLRREGFRSAMEVVMTIPVPVDKKDKFRGREYYGWSIRSEGQWYDPSILQFSSGEELRNSFSDAVAGYKEIMSQKLNVA